MKTSIKIALAAGIVPLLMSTTSFARGQMNHPGPMGHGPMGGPMQFCAGPGGFMAALATLNLTTEQKAKLFDLQVNMMKEHHGDFKHKGPGPKMDKPFKQMQQMMFSDHFDKEKFAHDMQQMAQQQHHQAEKWMQHHAIERAEFMHKQIAVLTNAQKAKLKEMMAKPNCGFMPGPMQ